MVNFNIMLKNKVDIYVSKNTPHQEHLHDCQFQNPIFSWNALNDSIRFGECSEV